MLLALLLLVLFLSGLLVLLLPNRDKLLKAAATVSIVVALVIISFIGRDIFDKSHMNGSWLMEFDVPWISPWHINFHLGMDSLAFWLSSLTLIMGLCAIYVARPMHKATSYYAAILWAIFGVIGLFLSADVFLFFVFWELALLPIYWMLLVHGGPGRVRTTLRFVVLTQASGLFLLISVIGLVYANFALSGQVTFSYHELLKTTLPTMTQYYLLAGFLLAFLIKLPAFPFHGWLPSLVTEAPAPIVLVGVLVKTAVFGLVRFSWPMFSEATSDFSRAIMLVGVFSLLYGAVLAFSQNEPKRVLAYSTLSHAGMLLMGVFCPNHASSWGVFLLLLTQALSSGGLLMIIDRLNQTHVVVDMNTTGGLWELGPRFSGMLLMLLLAGFGFPIFGNFMGEWWILWGVFSREPLISVFASIGVVLSAVYSLWLFQRLCFGKATPQTIAVFPRDLSNAEITVYGLMLMALLVLGFYPSVVLDQINPSLGNSTAFFYRDVQQVMSP